MSSIFLLFTLPDLINELANQMSLFKEKKKKSTTKRENMYIACLFFLRHVQKSPHLFRVRDAS